MKLDSRIIDGMKPLGVFDTEEAKRFIGKECYFANAESVFSNIDDNPFVAKGILTSIDENSEYAFHSEGTLKSLSVRHILPCEWVIEQRNDYEDFLKIWCGCSTFDERGDLKVGKWSKLETLKLPFSEERTVYLLKKYIVGIDDSENPKVPF